MSNQNKLFVAIVCCFAQWNFGSFASASSIGDCIAIEFMAENHSECKEMHRITDLAIQDGWVVRRIDTKREPHIALRWHITTVPTTVLVRNGREIDRILGTVNHAELQKRLIAASSIDSVRNNLDRRPERLENDTPKLRGQSQLNLVPMVNASALSNSALSNSALSNSLLSKSFASAFDSRQAIKKDPPSLSRQPQTLPNSTDPQGATVRIRVQEPQHESVGTGTIIDSHNGEALVLTCGHLFRENHDRSKITVEMFLNGQIQTYSARLIDFVAKDMDIGLISFHAGGEVPIARLIPKNRTLNEGQPVFSWGCDRGSLPSRRDSKITKLNRYLGAANVEVEGEPVEGRSGGGLFDENGELIGVCYAADPELKEGLYNAADVVYFELAKLGLQRLFNDRNDRPDSTMIAKTQNPKTQNPNQTANTTPEMTVILRGRDGAQEQITIPQPAPHLLQAVRDSARRE